MTEPELIETFVRLYARYLTESVEERTVLLTDPNDFIKKPRELRGNLDGFMRWMQKSLLTKPKADKP
jgi:hypothetical protein